ncbi:tetratricopeptide repeat protein [Sulfuricystis thermophila]|uniref:tetratricopeptide repeat protein n=1 Tax=Sulfuricystis thermophila TaxID=2496847 RepID=UPI001036DAC1|nr:tetratricopeptide repeat protein [Sulfuricystis thermophila]
MSQHAIDVSIADFDDKVLAASRRVPVIVDFWAPWCQPCRILKPILEKLAAEYSGKFILAKINSDENQALAMRYGVRGIPAVKAFVGGELVDEFTGALPEAQIREFLDRLIPSPAEPLRREALSLAAAGNLVAARQKMAEAIDLDPRNDTAYLDFIQLSLDLGTPEALSEASELLAAVADRVRDQDRAAALKARIEMAQTASGVDLAALATRLERDANDHEARLQLANALALRQDYRGALEHLLEIVRRDRKWNDEAGRKGMLKLFTLLSAQPQYDDLVREFRIALARTLN